MTLSVIIVSYNVKYFLEQCLFSVTKAIMALDAEILVVDNHSSDGSLEYLQNKFPQVGFIANDQNIGFAKANNQALNMAKGAYILFLNPDTIVSEGNFEKCISFMESNRDAGAVGVRMIDGSGLYLKESKRGFPSPWVAFCKIAGLTAIFPHSRVFAGYYLGHLGESELQPVDVLPGAFMMIRKEILDKTGGFDQRFFMYAEDIDLSYRIQQAGFKNYYLPEITILHYKGESTQKDFRYVKLFYKAMSQFVRKHFSNGPTIVFSALMEMAIWVRAGVSAMGHLYKPKSTKPEIIHSLVQGNTGDFSLLEKKLREYNRVIVKTKSEAEEIIFLEGDDFSFADILKAFEHQKGAFEYKIHAKNSGSIVGSGSKKIRGEALPL